MKIDIEKAVEQYAQEIYWLAYTYVKDYSLAEDIVQETFIKVVKSSRSFMWRSSLKTWIYTIARNLCKDHLKSAYMTKVIVSDDAEVVPHFTTPESELLTAEKKGEISDMVLRLPLKYKEIIILHYFSGLTIKEISKTMSINNNTVKSRLKRAKELLKDQIGEGPFHENR